MQLELEKESDIKNESSEKNGKLFYIKLAGVFFISIVTLTITQVINNGLFDRSAKNIYADLKDYQSCKVVSNEENFKAMGSRTVTNALVCELSPIQQKTPDSVQLAQNKAIKISKEIENYKENTIKELSSLLADDFVKKNPERAIDNIVADMKSFDLCLVVSSDKKMVVDCSLKEKASIISSNRILNEVDRVNEYYQKQSRINHQLSLINERYYPYFNTTLNKDINNTDKTKMVVGVVEGKIEDESAIALKKKTKALQEYEALVIEKKIHKLKKEIKKDK